LGYTVVAIAVALTLPYGAQHVDRMTAILVGAIVFLFGALLHEVTARQQRDRSVARWLARLRSGDEEIAAGLDQLHEELRLVRGGPPAPKPQPPRKEAVPPPPPPPPPPQPSAERAAERASMIAELRSLKDVVTRLRSRPAEAPPAEPAPSRVEPMVEEPAPPGPRRPTEREVAEAVRATLTGERVEVLSQPVVTLPQRRHRHSAVFPRLRLADGTVVGPELYQPVAKAENMVAFIDNLLLFRCIQLAREAERRGQPIGVLCAISPDALSDEAFTGQFMQFMAHNQGLASRLVFVLPQSEVFDDESPPRPAMAELARLGFRFAMDAVVHLEFDAPDLVARHVRYLVLDAGMLLDPMAPLGGMDAALALKHELDRNAVDLIVAGIETEQQLVELLDLHLDLGQGPLFGEAKPLA
jgi:cyclic-di-GMP phosphodiesterase TipF (flagellum assembly factor)